MLGPPLLLARQNDCGCRMHPQSVSFYTSVMTGKIIGRRRVRS
jgi:hypothetical protein